MSRKLFGIASMFALVAAVAAAQQTSTRTVNFEVVSVDGNTIVWRNPAGETKEFVAPPGFTVTMDGKQLGVADLKPGMKGTASVTTTTTEKMVYVTEHRNAEVLAVSGTAIIARGQDGQPKKWTKADVEKRNITLYRNGAPAEISDFRPGDKLTATIVTDQPVTTVSQGEVNAMVNAPAASKPAPVAAAPPPPAPAAPAPAPAPMAETLPKTASPLPLVGLLGALSLAAGFGLTALRRSRAAK
jgi:hypothetical protein